MPPSLCSLCFTVKVYESKSQIPTKECHLIILDKKENKHIFCLICNYDSFEIKFLRNLLHQVFLRFISEGQFFIDYRRVIVLYFMTDIFTWLQGLPYMTKLNIIPNANKRTLRAWKINNSCVTGCIVVIGWNLTHIS